MRFWDHGSLPGMVAPPAMSGMPRWLLALIVVSAAMVIALPMDLDQDYRLEDLILPAAFSGALILALAVYFLTFPYGLAIIHKGIRRATEGTLDPIKMPRRIRFLFGPLIDDYNVLVRNVSSLFREMEQSQLAIIGDRNRNDAILRSLPGALLTVDGDFRVTLSNKQAELMFDTHAQGLQGRGLFELLPLSEAGRELLREAFLYEQQVNNKEIVLNDGKTLRHYTLNITFFKESQTSNEYCAAVMLQDITDNKRLRELVHQSEKFLAIGKLAGGVAHELNTPLGTIVGYAQLLNAGVDNEDKRLDYTRTIYTEAKRCSNIIESLRAFAQRDICQPESCAVSRVIHDVVDTIYNCPGKRHNVTIETRLNTDVLVRGAEGQLDIVLVNLIMNAVQSAAGVASDPLVTVDCTARNDSVQITITDNGPGIPQAQRNQVFDPFFSTKPDGSGLGLGLAISQSIVAGIGGNLSCDADYEGGARFVMTLPLAFGEQE